MVVEHAIIPVKPGTADEFLAAWRKARELLKTAKGCLTAEMHRGIENPDRYMLLVTWEELSDHMTSFRQSPAMEEFRRLLSPYYAGTSTMEHYSPPL
jgi:heme-degrading monooxygenase HmoA